MDEIFEFVCANCQQLIAIQETAVAATNEGWICDQCLEEWRQMKDRN